MEDFRMPKTWIVLFLTLSVLGGCSFIKGQISDYNLGRKSPLSAGELSPKDVAQPYGDLVGTINPAAGKAVSGILVFFLTLRRGRRIRKNLPVSDNPFTGFLGSITGIESVVQQIANVRSGLFDVGPNGSPIKRGWKMSVILLLAAVVTPLVSGIPAVSGFLATHGSLAIGVTGVLAVIIASFEKAISKALPVKG